MDKDEALAFVKAQLAEAGVEMWFDAEGGMHVSGDMADPKARKLAALAIAATRGLPFSEWPRFDAMLAESADQPFVYRVDRPTAVA